MQGVIKKLMKIKGIGYILLALAAAIILLLMPAGKTEEKETGRLSAEEYALSLESKARNLISKISGVGSCNVMITLESGYRYIYACDEKLKQAYDAQGNEVSKDAEKEYVTVTVDGDGAPVLLKEMMPQVSGIAVVCPGISGETELRVIKTLEALFGVASNKISVQT